MRAFRAFLKHLLATPPNSPPAQKGGWFDWIPGATKSPTITKVEPPPNIKDASGAPEASVRPTSEPLPNPWTSAGGGGAIGGAGAGAASSANGIPGS